MRPIYYLLPALAFMCCFRSFGQPVRSATSTPFDDPMIRKILQRQQSHQIPLSRGSATPERLTGYVGKSYNGAGILEYFDTTYYYYGAVEHPSYLDNNNPDSYTEVIYQGMPIQTMPALRFFERPTVGFDSAYSLHMAFSRDTFIDHTTRGYSGGLLIYQADTFRTATTPSNFPRTDKYHFDYNTDSQIVKADYDIVSMSDVSGTSFRTFSMGNEVKDSFVDIQATVPFLMSVTNRSFDASGNLDTVSYRYFGYGRLGKIAIRESYAYTSNNMLLVHFHEDRPMGNDSLTLTYVDTFTYSGSRVSNITSYYRNAQDSTWAGPNNQRFEYHFDGSGNVDTMIEGKFVTGFTPTQKIVYKYTPNGHFDEILTYTANSGRFKSSPNGHLKFYYKIDAPQSIKNPGNTNYVQLFPNPAENRLCVRFRQTPKSTVAVTIINTAGQVMRRFWVDNANSELSLTGLEPGNYFANFKDAQNVQSVPFLKQ